MQHHFLPEVEQILATLPVSRPSLVLAPTLSGITAEMVEPALPEGTMRLAVVSDERTYEILGERVERELSARYATRKINLTHWPQPSSRIVMQLVKDVEVCDALVAVGSGTINDLCKYAAHLAQKPYIVFPTAPSMNGYTSANASIVTNEAKQSFPAHLPAAVLCDLNVIAAAPVRLLRAGLGDSLARPTAQADWLMAHLLNGTPYDERPFALTAPYEPGLYESAEALGKGDREAVKLLMQVLLLSGYGMTLAGGSYPASQGEHMIAHAYEMNHTAQGQHVDPFQPVEKNWPLHGEQIGVTTLTMARLQEKRINSLPLEVAERIRRVMLPASMLETILSRAGSPTTPQQLGWNEADYLAAIAHAPSTRDRFTFLNIED